MAVFTSGFVLVRQNGPLRKSCHVTQIGMPDVVGDGFDSYDQNRDGVITHEEWARRLLSVPVQRRRLDDDPMQPLRRIGIGQGEEQGGRRARTARIETSPSKWDDTLHDLGVEPFDGPSIQTEDISKKVREVSERIDRVSISL